MRCVLVYDCNVHRSVINNHASRITVIHSARLVSGGTLTNDAWVRFRGDRVDARGIGDGWRTDAAADHDTLDAAGRILTPGFIDLHCHGGGGFVAEDGASAIDAILRTHRAHGTTRAVLSLVSAPVPQLCESVAIIAEATHDRGSLLGAHLEGPFLSDGHRGAHDPRALRDPDRAAIDELLSAAAGSLRQVTLAPERPGAAEAIGVLIDNDVRVAVGHTSGGFDQARRAFDQGASILTHAFNGMPGIHHRAPGPVVAALQSSHVTLEIINDGVHVDPRVVELAFTAAPGRIALITDAMAAAGAADGRYRLGGLEVVVQGSVARLAVGDSIAGSTLTLDRAVRHAVNEVGIDLVRAVDAVTTVPAAAIGQEAELGRLSPGFLADAVLFDADLHVAHVWTAGIPHDFRCHPEAAQEDR